MPAHKVVSVPKVNCVCDSGRAARGTNSVSFQPSWLLGPFVLLGTNLAAPPARFYASTTKPWQHARAPPVQTAGSATFLCIRVLRKAAA